MVSVGRPLTHSYRRVWDERHSPTQHPRLWPLLLLIPPGRHVTVCLLRNALKQPVLMVTGTHCSQPASQPASAPLPLLLPRAEPAGTRTGPGKTHWDRTRHVGHTGVQVTGPHMRVLAVLKPNKFQPASRTRDPARPADSVRAGDQGQLTHSHYQLPKMPQGEQRPSSERKPTRCGCPLCNRHTAAHCQARTRTTCAHPTWTDHAKLRRPLCNSVRQHTLQFPHPHNSTDHRAST